jgi:hypothetical protein
MKSGNPTLINYTAKKILKRLAMIANTNMGSQCLSAYNKEQDLNWASQFHYLDLETLGMWGELYQNQSEKVYFSYAKMLKESKLLPVKEKYWNYPSSGEREQTDSQYGPAGELKSRVASETQRHAQGS